VACGVVQAQALLCVLFNQQITAIFFKDGSHCDTGIPTIAHILEKRFNKPMNIDFTNIYLMNRVWPQQVKIYKAQ
jgi:hypothetical protein